MATNLPKVITYERAVQMFIDHELPDIQNQYEQDGIPDYIARREHWFNWVDWMCVNKEISDWQAENWSVPDICCQESKMTKKYKVIRLTRTGVSRFEEKESVMTEEMLRMNFPTWKGDTVHRVGKFIYQINEIKE